MDRFDVPFLPVALSSARAVKPALRSLVSVASAFFAMLSGLLLYGAARYGWSAFGIGLPQAKRAERPKHDLFSIGFVGGKPRFARSFREWTLSSEPNRYSVDALTIVFGIIAFIVAFYVGTFTDTQPSLAFKAGLLLGIMGVAVAMMGFFGWLISVSAKHDMVFTFQTSISGKAISTGFIAFGCLILGQVFVFTGLPLGFTGNAVSFSLVEIAAVVSAIVWILGGQSVGSGAKAKGIATGILLGGSLVATAALEQQGLSYLVPGVPYSSFAYTTAYSVGSLATMLGWTNPVAATLATTQVTIAPNPQLVGLFYTTSAIAESFALQGFEYSFLMVILANFDPHNFSWKNHIIASGAVVATAGILHFAVYQLNFEATLAVMVGFAILNFVYELTDSLNAVIIAHVALNIVSTLSGSVAVPSGSALGIVWAFPALAASFAALAGILAFRQKRRGLIYRVGTVESA